nr:aspartic proteinase-like protein 2 [Tanacetum cinerariifolium]
MPSKSGGLLVIILLAVVAAVCDGGAMVLSLKRDFLVNKTVEVEILKARDHLRHARVLQGGGVVDFDVFGTSDPYYGGSSKSEITTVFGSHISISESKQKDTECSQFLRRVCLLTLPSPKNKCKPLFHNDVKKFDDTSQVVVAKMTADILELEATPQEEVQDFCIDS